jgi:hypothetical protein
MRSGCRPGFRPAHCCPRTYSKPKAEGLDRLYDAMAERQE